MTCDRNRRSTENLPSGFFSAQTGYLMSEKWTFSVAILMILIPQGGKAAIRFRVGGIWAGDWCNSVGLRRKSEWRQRLRLFVKCISINFLLARSSRFLIYFFKKRSFLRLRKRCNVMTWLEGTAIKATTLRVVDLFLSPSSLVSFGVGLMMIRPELSLVPADSALWPSSAFLWSYFIISPATPSAPNSFQCLLIKS